MAISLIKTLFILSFYLSYKLDKLLIKDVPANKLIRKCSENTKTFDAFSYMHPCSTQSVVANDVQQKTIPSIIFKDGWDPLQMSESYINIKFYLTLRRVNGLA